MSTGARVVWTLLLACVVSGGPPVLAAPGVTDTTITVGLLTPPGDPNCTKAPCSQVRTGMEAYFKWKGQQVGAVAGRQVVVKPIAMPPDVRKKVAEADKVLEKEGGEVLVFLSPVDAAQTIALFPLVDRHKIPLLFPATGAEGIGEPAKRFVFASPLDYRDLSRVAVDFALRNGRKKIGILYRPDPDGRAFLLGAEDRRRQVSVPVVAHPVATGASPDVKQGVEKLRGEAVDVVLLAAPSEQAAAILETAVDQWGQAQPMWIVAPYALDPAFVAKAISFKQQTGGGVRAVMPFQGVPFQGRTHPPMSAQHRQAVAEFQQIMGAKPIAYYTLLGYVHARLFAEAVGKVEGKPDRSQLIRVLERERIETGLGPFIRYSVAERTSRSTPVIHEIE